MKITAIFSDYDGTLAPDDVPREVSQVRRSLLGPLERLASRIPLAIITSKDYSFVGPRTPFASAWACVSGLDIVVKGRKLPPDPQTSGRLEEAVEVARRILGPGPSVELKRSATSNRLLGFSIDWRLNAVPTPGNLRALEERLSAMGLWVVYDPQLPFVDAFGAEPDKGTALNRLKGLLGVRGKVLFLGDSRSDVPALRSADMGICVDHGQDLDVVGWPHSVPVERLAAFLDDLYDNDLEADAPGPENLRFAR